MLGKNDPGIIYAACSIANYQNKKGQVFEIALSVPRNKLQTADQLTLLTPLE